MNVLFLTMSPQILKLQEHNIYNDLVRKFLSEGHNMYIMVPYERRTGKATSLHKEGNVTILGVKTLNLTKAGVVEKGIGQVMLERQFMAAFKEYLSNVRFDLILYSTPPITFSKVIAFAKKLNPKATSYLMLKDIFPQNAVDINMLKTTGLKGVLYKSFRKKEKELYKISDWVGCMSPANVRYVIDHNVEVNPQKVEICPNSYDVLEISDCSKKGTTEIREKYGLPIDKPIFIYGGNLGKPQGIPFLVDCLRANKDRTDCHFVVVGKGTEYGRLEAFVNEEKPKSVSLFDFIPKEDYDNLSNACDVGLIFLDYRFTIPNYPSRLLPYLMNRKPILAVTDPNCDTGSMAVENGYGMWAPSNSVEAFTSMVDKILTSDLKQMGENGYQFYLNNYTVSHTYNAIMKHFE